MCCACCSLGQKAACVRFTHESQILCGTLCHPKVSSPIYSCPSIKKKKKLIYTSQSSFVLLKGWRVVCGIFRLWLMLKFPNNILAEWVSEGSSYPQEERVTFWSSLSWITMLDRLESIFTENSSPRLGNVFFETVSVAGVWVLENGLNSKMSFASVHFGSWYPIKLKLKFVSELLLSKNNHRILNWAGQNNLDKTFGNCVKFPPNIFWELSSLHCFCFLLAHSWQYLMPEVVELKSIG